MGIPSYFNFIIKNYNKIFKTQNEIEIFNNLFLDCNSIIYDKLNKLDYKEYATNNLFEIKLMNEVCKQIEKYVNTLNIQNNVFISFDGVAPYAKIQQQRQRRFKTPILKNYENIITEINNSKTWDKAAITPGTNFMNKLSIYVNEYFKNTNNNINYIISGSEIEGEGEQKIFSFFRENLFLSEHTNFIYGLDADLIMLSLNHLYISDKIYLCRELPDFNNELNEIYDIDEICIMDINEFSNIIYDFMIDNKTNNNPIDNHKKYKINDYIFMSFLLGNDFLPHFPSLNIRTNGIQYLIDTYKKVIKYNDFLCFNNNIQWKNLKKFIKELALNEEQYFINEYNIRNKQEKKFYKTTSIDEKLRLFQLLPVYNRDNEKYINPTTQFWQNRYYKKLLHINDNNNTNFIKNLCINYLEGLEWTFFYYNEKCINNFWYYKYHYPPLLEDLVKYIPSFNCSMNEIDNNKIHPITQLSYVLPGNSLHLLPDKIYKYMITEYKDIYYNDPILVWTYCKYMWESHIELPIINIKNLDKKIRKLLNEI